MQTRILTTLRNKLAALPASKLTLDAETLAVDDEARGVEDITLDLALYFGAPQLDVYNARIGEPDATGNFVLHGTGRLLRYEEVPLRILFFLSERPETDESSSTAPGVEAGVYPHLECVLEVEQFPDTWELARSYPDLPGFMDFSPARPGDGERPSLLRHIALRQCSFAYCSLDFARTAERRRAALLREHVTTLPAPPMLQGRLLERGLNFEATMTQRAPIYDATLTMILPQLGAAGELPVYGSASRQFSGLFLHLYHDIQDGAWTLGEDGALALRLRRVGLVSGLAGIATGAPAYQIDAVLGEPGDLEFAVSVYKTFGERRLVIEGAFQDGRVFALDRALALIDQPALLEALPAPLQKTKDVGLQYLLTEVAYPENAARPEVERLTVRLSVAEPWDVLSGKIAIQPLLQWSATHPFNKARSKSTLQIGGVCSLGATNFDVLVVPANDTISVNMAVGSRLDAGAVLSKWFPGLPLPDIQFLDLDLNANLASGDFMAVIDARTDLKFNVGGADLRIKAIQINVDSNDDRLSGILRGELEAAGYEATVELALAEEWTATVELPELPVTDLANEFLTLIALPGDLPDFTLRDVVLSVSPTSRTFSIYGASDTTLSIGRDLQAKLSYFEVSRERVEKTESDAAVAPAALPAPATYTVSAMLGIDLTLGGVQLQLNAFRKGASISGDAGWTYAGGTGPGETIGLRDLTAFANQASGVALLSPSEVPEFIFQDVQLKYARATGEFEVLGQATTPLHPPFFDAPLTVNLELRSAPANRKPTESAYHGLLRGRAKISGVDASLSAFLEKTIEWRGTLSSFSVGALARQVSPDVAGILPADLLDLNFRNLDLRYTPATGAYRMEGELFTRTGKSASLSLVDFLPISFTRLALNIRRLPPAAAEFRVTGLIALNSSSFEIEIEYGPEPFLRAKNIARLSLGQFVRTLFSALPGLAGPALASANAFLDSVYLENATFSVGLKSGAVALAGSSPAFRAIELRAQRTQKSGWQLAIGANPAPDFNFAKALGQAFAALDKISKNGPFLFAESAFLLGGDSSGGGSPGFTAVSTPGGITSGGGLTLALPIDFSATPLGKLFGAGRINVAAVIGDPANVRFAVKLADGLRGPLIDFGPLQVSVKPYSPPAFGIAGDLTLKIFGKDNLLKFRLDGELNMVGGSLTGRLERWNKPFGIPGVELRDLTLGLLAAGSLLTIQSLNAEARLGDVRGRAAFAFKKGDPTKSGLALEFSTLRLRALLGAFVNALPPPALRFTDIITLENALIQAAPFGFDEYESGVRVKADASFGLPGLSLRGRLEGELEISGGARLAGALDPIELAPFLSIRGADPKSGPRFSLELSADNPHLAVDGQLRVLGLSGGGASIQIGSGGLRFNVERSLGPMQVSLQGELKEFRSLIARGKFRQNLNLPIPALSLKIPVIGRIPIWPKFTLSAGLQAKLFIESDGTSMKVQLSDAGFHWSGESWSVPPLSLTLDVHDLSKLPEAIHRHILENVERIFEKLIDAVRKQFENVVGKALEYAEDMARRAIDVRANAVKAAGLALEGVDLGADLAKIGVDELRDLGETMGKAAEKQAKLLAEQAEKAARAAEQAAEKTAKYMNKQIKGIARTVKKALSVFAFWNW